MSSEPTWPGDACVLIDANNIMHRYYHGRPTMVRQGRNINAAHGLGELVDRLRRFKPHSVVAVFDGGHSHRQQLLPQYKAHRDGTPPDLAFQLDLAANRLPFYHGADTLQVPPYEADDVISSLTETLRRDGRAVVVVSNDKDLCHLVVDEPPRVLMFRRGDSWRLVDEAAVAVRLGVRPRESLDFLALCGDTADGIPGVPGIGPKTAADLLAKYGTLEALLAAPLAEERPRVRELLNTHREAARASRRVVAPVPVPIADIGRGLRTSRGAHGSTGA